MFNTVAIKKSKSKAYFGYELARLGFITISHDWLGSGEREKWRDKNLLFFRSETHRSNWVRFIGLDMIGIRVTEVMALINYLETREEVDSNHIGILGHSGGGTISLFSTIAEKRINVTGISGYFGTWDDSLLAMYNCGCDYISNLRKYVELYDIFASIAPYPVVVCIGKKDRFFPIEGVKKAIPIIEAAYKESNHPENFIVDMQPKGHIFYRDKIYPFLSKYI